MSFLKSLFGGKKDEAPAGDKVLGQEEYKGFVIKALEMTAGGEYQLCGLIEKEIGGETRSYRFVRADRIADRAQLVQLSIAKGRQIVDEQGEKVFS